MAYMDGQKRRKKESRELYADCIQLWSRNQKKNIPLHSMLDIFRQAVSYFILVYAET